MAFNNTPSTFSFQIPFILLGRRGIRDDLDYGADRHVERLNLVCQMLQHMCPEITVKTWVPRMFKEEESMMLGTEEERRVLKDEIQHRRWEWLEEERKRWELYEGSGAWILRLTSTIEQPCHGVFEGSKEGDDLLTPRELKLKAEGMWMSPFLLQRFGIVVHQQERFAEEIGRMLDVFKAFSTLEHPEFGNIFQVIAGERCWPRISFHSSTEKHPSEWRWDQRTLHNLIILLTAFERELFTLCIPSFLLSHWPLSHFLTHRAAQQYRKKREEMWANLAVGGSMGKKERRRMWKTQRSRSIEGMEWEDEKDKDRENVLGETKKAWWENVEETDIGTLVRDMAGFERKGGRLVLGLRIEGDTDAERAEKIDEAKSTMDANTNGDTESSDRDLCAPLSPLWLYNDPARSPLPSPPLPFPFPHIRTITFPLPRTSPTLSYAPLITYISFMVQILHYAQQHTEDMVHSNIGKIRDMSELLNAGPLVTLAKLAQSINVQDDHIQVWEKEVELYWVVDSSPQAEKTEDLEAILVDRQEDGVATKVKTDPSVDGAKTKINLSAPLLKHLEEAMEREQTFVPQFIQRYERAGGFLVPSRTKVHELAKAEISEEGDSIDTLGDLNIWV